MEKYKILYMTPKRIALLCCFICILFSDGYSQRPTSSPKDTELFNILNQTHHTYKKITTISGTLELKTSSPEPGVNFTINHVIGHICQKRITKDTIWGWYVANEFRDEQEPSDKHKAYYNGDSLIFFYSKDSSIVKESPLKTQDFGFSTFNDWKEKIELYKERLLLTDSLFQKKERAWLTGNITLGKDTVINGKTCYVIKNRKEGNIPKFQVRYINSEIMAIDKKTFYPVFSRRHFQRFVNEQPQIDQTIYEILSNIKLNESVPNTVFEMKEKGKITTDKTITTVKLKIGDLAPNWKLRSISGDTISLYDQKEKPIILVFSYIGCGACISMMHEVKEEVLNVSDRKAFHFIYIDPIDSFEFMKKYAKELKIDYPMLVGTKKLTDEYGISNGFPYILILNKDHTIQRIFPGYFKGVGKAIKETIDTEK